MQCAARVREQYAGEAEYTHDFNLGNIRLAHDTIREVQQHQPQRVPWRCVPSPGVLPKVEGWVEDLAWRQELLKPSVDRKNALHEAGAGSTRSAVD